MLARKNISREIKKNNITIMLEVQNGSDAEMMIKEIKKAIHKWNHLLKNELSFKMITIQPNENNLTEQ